MNRRRHYRSVDSVRNQAGVGDQSDECKNGSVGCPGPDSDVSTLPCFSCLLEAGESDREVVTDGGQSSSGTERSNDDLLPPRDGETNTIPDVEPGDEIHVRSVYNTDPNRTLTVSEVDRDDVVILEGYGTEYVLSAEDSINHRRVYLQWQSRPEGVPIADIEVREEGGRDV